MLILNYGSTITKAISMVALVSSTCAIANTQTECIAYSTTQANFTSKLITRGNLVYAAKTSQGFSEQFSTFSENSLVDHVKSTSELQSEILAFNELLGCWDGDNAEPIAKGAINSAHQFLESYDGNLMFEVFPDPDGSVGLQADFADGRVILSFDDAGEIAYLIRINKAVHRGHSTTHESINSLFSSLL